jgi:hypothetical protein
MNNPSSPAGGQNQHISAAGGGALQHSGQGQAVSQLAQGILQRNERVQPGTQPTLHLPQSFGRRETKGHLVTKAIQTEPSVIKEVEALILLIAQKFRIDGLLESVNFEKGFLVYYKKDQVDVVEQQGQAPKIVKKEGEIPTTLNLSEMLFKKPFDDVKEIYELGDAIFRTWDPGKKAFILGCKTQYQPTGTKSFQGYENYDVLNGWTTCPRDYKAKQQVDKVLDDFQITDVKDDQKTEVIQKYQLERALGSNPDEYNPGKILALLGKDPCSLIGGILRDEVIEKSVGKFSFFRDKGKVQQKIELRNRFIAECCGYSENEACQATYHEYFRNRPPFPFRDNMGITEHFEPLKEFSTDEEIRVKLGRFERKDFLEKFNQISSNAYRTTLQKLVPDGSQDRLQQLRSLDTEIRGLPEQKGEDKWRENYQKLRKYDFEHTILDLVAECGVDKLIEQLKIKEGDGSNYRFGADYLLFVESYLTQQLLKNRKFLMDLTPQQIEICLKALIGKTKSETPSPSDRPIPTNRADWNGSGLKLEINNEQLANQIWIAIHAPGFVPTNPSALSGWYQEFRSNPPEGKTLQEFLNEKERDFQGKLAFVRGILPSEPPAPEGGSAAAAGGGSAGPVSESSGRKKEEQYIALELQKNWNPHFSNQDECLRIRQILGDRKALVERIISAKKSALDQTQPGAQNRNKKIEEISKDISQIAIDSFKFDSEKLDQRKLDQLVEDWINSVPDLQAP